MNKTLKSTLLSLAQATELRWIIARRRITDGLWTCGAFVIGFYVGLKVNL